MRNERVVKGSKNADFQQKGVLLINPAERVRG